MKIFTGNSNPKFAEGIAKYLGIPLGQVDLRKFSDGELYVAFNENIRNEEVFIIQSTNPPAENFLGLVPPAALVFAALGSILFGFATPTEAAGCGAMGAMLLALA